MDKDESNTKGYLRERLLPGTSRPQPPRAVAAVFDELMSEAEFAKARGLTVRSLQWARKMRKGPAYVKIGRSIYYRRSAVEAWLAAHEVSSELAPSERLAARRS